MYNWYWALHTYELLVTLLFTITTFYVPWGHCAKIPVKQQQRNTMQMSTTFGVALSSKAVFSVAFSVTFSGSFNTRFLHTSSCGRVVPSSYYINIIDV